jgi:hypothetical protein
MENNFLKQEILTIWDAKQIFSDNVCFKDKPDVYVKKKNRLIFLVSPTCIEWLKDLHTGEKVKDTSIKKVS